MARPGSHAPVEPVRRGFGTSVGVTWAAQVPKDGLLCPSSRYAFLGCLKNGDSLTV